jgi:hypothetical protein
MPTRSEDSLYASELGGPTLAFQWTEATALRSEEDCQLRARASALLIDTRRFQVPRETPGA